MTLARLWTYARGEKIQALENFTTEALAAAIEEDPEPFLRLVREARALPVDGVATEVACRTQVGVGGVGIIDIVIDLHTPPFTHQVWVEVKVWAGESGQQLDTYRRYLKGLPGATPPILITLSKMPIRKDSDLAWVSWQSVWRAAAQSPGSTYWRDLRGFLEEIDMADAYDQPVSAAEAAALEPSGILFGKSKRILATVVQGGRDRWQQFSWPRDERQVQRELANQFGWHGRFFCKVGEEYEAYLLLGVTPIDGEAHTSIWVETRPKSLEARRSVVTAADSAGLRPAWVRSLGAWGGLQITERMVRFQTNEAAVQWYLDCIEELDGAGLLALIPRLGRSAEADGDDDESAPEVRLTEP